MPGPQQQTFSNVQPITQSFTDVSPISSGAQTDVKEPDFWDTAYRYSGIEGLMKAREASLKALAPYTPEHWVKRGLESVSDWAHSKAAELESSQVKAGAASAGKQTAMYGANVLSDTAKIGAETLDPNNQVVAAGAALAPEVAGPAFLVHGGTGVVKNISKANTPEGLQSTLLSGAEAAGGAAASTATAASIPETVRSGWRKAGNPFGLASTGEELLTQGISPRTSLTKFQPSLQRAAGDLKAFDAQSPIKNVHDLNDAIPEIKQKIWSEEVEPALQRQATKPVNMQPVADKVRAQISDEMRTFDEPNATKLETLATKLEGAKDVTSANSLLKYANGQLESYFQKFPAARRANLMNNPETAGWEAARSELRNQFLSTLEDAGETGVRDARLRYGAFDTLQDAVERRVNVADRAKPMSLGRIVGLAGAPATGGLSIIAGELSNYLNKPDVLIRRGIGKLASSPSRTEITPPISISGEQPQAQPLAATGTTGRQTSGPQRPALLQGSPGRFNTPEANAAIHSQMIETTIKQLDERIAKETNPAEKLRLRNMKADYETGNI